MKAARDISIDASSIILFHKIRKIVLRLFFFLNSHVYEQIETGSWDRESAVFQIGNFEIINSKFDEFPWRVSDNASHPDAGCSDKLYYY